MKQDRRKDYSGRIRDVVRAVLFKMGFAARKLYAPKVNFSVTLGRIGPGGFDGWLRGLEKFLSTFYLLSRYICSRLLLDSLSKLVLFKHRLLEASAGQEFLLSLNTKNIF